MATICMNFEKRSVGYPLMQVIFEYCENYNC